VPSGRLLLLRHGETEWSRDKKHTGQTDVELTATGEQQARDLAPALAGLRPVLVLCSPMKRARRTAELAGLPPVTVDADLAEWGYGDYEGITTEEIRRSQPGWTVWTHLTPGGETAQDVSARADRALHRVAGVLAEGDVVVVGHGHFNRVLAARWLGLDARNGQLFALDTGTICVLGYEHEQQVLLRWNMPGAAGSAAL